MRTLIILALALGLGGSAANADACHKAKKFLDKNKAPIEALLGEKADSNHLNVMQELAKIKLGLLQKAVDMKDPIPFICKYLKKKVKKLVKVVAMHKVLMAGDTAEAVPSAAPSADATEPAKGEQPAAAVEPAKADAPAAGDAGATPAADASKATVAEQGPQPAQPGPAQPGEDPTTGPTVGPTTGPTAPTSGPQDPNAPLPDTKGPPHQDESRRPDAGGGPSAPSKGGY